MFFFRIYATIHTGNPFAYYSNRESGGSSLLSTSTSVVADSRATRQLPDNINIVDEAYRGIEILPISILSMIYVFFFCSA